MNGGNNNSVINQNFDFPNLMKETTKVTNLIGFDKDLSTYSSLPKFPPR